MTALRLRPRNPDLVLRYEDELRIFRGGPAKTRLSLLVALYLLLPMFVQDDFRLTILNYAGIAAVGAVGLNLLTGFAGQVSLGHAFFIGTGAYCATWFGGDRGWPLPLWLAAAAVVGGVIGGVIGPFALRLRGNYLAVVSLGLVFLGLHIFENWESLTGGANGTSVEAPLTLGPLDFGDLRLGGEHYTRNQGMFWLIWGIVAIVALVTKNVVRTRPGRALQAVRDRDLAAEVIGVSMARYKVGAFVLSSAMASVAGALFGAYQQYVNPDAWNLLLSIQYIAIIIVGGIGTIFGSVLGALFLGGMPSIVERFSDTIPFVAHSASDEGLTLPQLNQLLFGALIVAFLVLEPRGLAAVWLRVKTWFRTWPFSY